MVWTYYSDRIDRLRCRVPCKMRTPACAKWNMKCILNWLAHGTLHPDRNPFHFVRPAVRPFDIFRATPNSVCSNCLSTFHRWRHANATCQSTNRTVGMQYASMLPYTMHLYHFQLIRCKCQSGQFWSNAADLPPTMLLCHQLPHENRDSHLGGTYPVGRNTGYNTGCALWKGNGRKNIILKLFFKTSFPFQ